MLLRWSFPLALCCILTIGYAEDPSINRARRYVDSSEQDMELEKRHVEGEDMMGEGRDSDQLDGDLEKRHVEGEDMMGEGTDSDQLDDIDLDARYLPEASLDIGERATGSIPLGMQSIGIGYDLLKGNPDGGSSHNGGVDPGVKATRKILKLTYGDCLTNGPAEVDYALRSSCVNETTVQLYHGTRSYQKKFSVDVSADVSGSYGLAEFSFSASARYAQAKSETVNTKNMMRDEHYVCNRGRIRVKTELADIMKYNVTDSFAVSVCRLPTTYSQRPYMQFLSDWGTHMIVQTELGNKQIIRGKSSLKELIQSAMTDAGASVSASGSYVGYSASLSLNIDTFSQSDSFESNFNENKYTFTLGSESQPQPIGLKLKAMPYMLERKFWHSLPSFINRRICPSGTTHSKISEIKTNVIRALRAYPAHLSAQRPTDTPLRIPTVWPKGTYTLVQTRYGCPRHFLSGWRFHDTEDSNPSNYFSSTMYIRIDKWRNDLRWYFCTKTREHAAEYALDWPKGEYCIIKRGNCPSGFNLGKLKWDDEDSNNRNRYGGSKPDGSYGRDTTIYFCCRNDGFAVNPILLPLDKPFVLLRKGRLCQRVHGTRHELQSYVRWDDEDSRNADERTGSHPYDDGGSKDHKLHFCYYSKI